ncbi:MAG: hypothetical protein ISS77_05950 [Phycisphaerae bacterium]|nr:hypothetical protein [Phycisphaerae bacterium]
MNRNRKRKALFEVIGQSKLSTKQDNGVKKDFSALDATHKTSEKSEKTAGNLVNWSKKPKFIQVNNGRLEFSLPYQLAIVFGMLLILLFLVSFRTGQLSIDSQEPKSEPAVVKRTEKTQSPPKIIPAAAAVKIEDAAPAKNRAAVNLPLNKVSGNDNISGSNRIVIQSCVKKNDLEPVKRFFEGFGIGTEIREIGSRFFLVSSGKYDNPAKPGTDGYYAKKKIIELGAKYKAPAGYGNFGTKPFHDAYGMKFND